jgi:glycosyltransferase involved in cell wall biosynthesis
MNTWPIFAQFAVAFASKRISRPYIVHVQDIYPESLTNKLAGLIGFAANKLLIPVDRFVLRHANKILVISEKMKLYLSETRNLNKDKFEVVLNWQDDTAFQAYQNTWPTGLLTFMYLGNIGPVSNIPFVMNAFVKSCLPNARLIIAGVGSSKEACIKLAEKYPHIDIQFIEVPAGEVPLIQSQAHVMLLPLTKDAGHSSIPSKLPAYMFSSRPVIALAEKGTDIEKTITESGCGWVGDPVDEEWLINCFRMISDSDTELLVNKGKAGCQYAHLHFSKETNLNKLLKSMIN